MIMLYNLRSKGFEPYLVILIFKKNINVINVNVIIYIFPLSISWLNTPF